MNRHLFNIFAITFATIACGAYATQCIDRFQYLANVPRFDLASKPVGKDKAPRLSDVKAGLVTTDFSGKPLTPYLKPKPNTVRPNLDAIETSQVDFERLVVKFRDDTLGSALHGRLSLPDPVHGLTLEAIVGKYPDFEFRPALSGGDDWLTALRFCAADNTGSDFADLTSYFSAKIVAPQRKAAIQFLKELLNHPEVETAWLQAPLILPGADISPPTDPYDGQQKHFDAAPNGINIRSAWPIAGTKGDGLRYVDVEQSWTLDHEDFPSVGDFRTVFYLTPPGHGTAVVGILSAEHNGFGVQGGVPNAQANVASDINDLAVLLVSPLRAGDSIILEGAYPVDPKGQCGTSGTLAAVPLERDDLIFAEIQLLVANGVVVYEPAGNESLDLDAPCWNHELSREGRDSGAIMVAAGDVLNCGLTPTATLSAASFSNFGSRIDANAWGNCVTTTGWNGHLFNPGDIRQYYTQDFMGTSAATPIVMSAGIALQGWQKNRTGRVYNGVTMRALLQRYGTNTTGPHFIAKQPDVGATLAWLTVDDDGDSVINGDELSLAQDLIAYYYQRILRRDPEPGGKIYWYGEIERMRAVDVDPREAYRALAKAFFNSSEYIAYNRSNADFLEDLYQTFYQRTADSGGLNYWLGQMASGLNRESVLASFMFSTEFDNFMNMLLTYTPQRAELSLIIDGYRSAFARLPDTGGLLFYRGQLRAAICQNWTSVYNTANNFMWGLYIYPAVEYTNRQRSNGQYIADLYDGVFRRGSDLGGFLYWVGQLDMGTTRGSVLAAYFGSAEWSQRITTIASQSCIPP